MNDRDLLLERFIEVQEKFDRLCEPITSEEHRIQPIVEASPPWWSVMHTAWFYSRMILLEFGAYLPEEEKYDILLNSYYHSVGSYLDQSLRGKLSEPGNEEAHAYRRSVNGRMKKLISTIAEKSLPRLRFLLEIGLNHEEQHMELLVTDIKRIKGENPVAALRRPYCTGAEREETKDPGDPFFIPFGEGLCEIGNVEGGWCWDNELGIHKHHLPAFGLMNRLVTNGEYLEFMEDGGYGNYRLWLSSAYDAVIRKHLIKAPLYWEEREGERQIWTLSGMRKVDPNEPLCHVSFYEAHAFAQWKSSTDQRFKGARLPTEQEWEFAARSAGGIEGNYLESGRFHPAAAGEVKADTPVQMFGDVWEWTTSHYEPYPGYLPLPEGLAEYNAKFMNNQRVLRGGSCATPKGHIRISYRNFWAPLTRFQFTGFRLARGE